mmetsp:Transcript_1244/g.2783  ORF Transcript_1244/g.2783 Transcript_1244/m.2783 type:complete len:261 (-) Transcript_1244:1799-2581(-)
MNRGRKSGNESYIQSSPQNNTSESLSTKVLLVPLTNLSNLHLRTICPNAHRLVLCPTSSGVLSSVQSTNSSELANSNLIQNAHIHSYIDKASRVLQSLIIAKYQGMYIQAPPKGRHRLCDLQSNSKNQLDLISISFRGKIETFSIVDVSTANETDEQEPNTINDDEGNLSEAFPNLTVSCNEGSNDAKDGDAIEYEGEFLVRNLLKNNLEHHRRDETNGKESDMRCLSYKITSQTEISFVSSLERASSIEKSTNLTAEAK